MGRYGRRGSSVRQIRPLCRLRGSGRPGKRPVSRVLGRAALRMNIRDAFKITEPRRCSDPEPYTEEQPVIDPLTQRRAQYEKVGRSTSDQALARGHWIDAL